MTPKRKAGRPPATDETRKGQHQFRCPQILWEKAEKIAAERGYANVAELIRQLLRELPDPKFYTARTKRAVNSLTVERGPKGGAA